MSWKTESDRPLLARLIGLETEYAALLDLPADQASIPSRSEIFDSVVSAVRRRVPAVPGMGRERRWFLANGGSLSLESNADRLDAPGGLIEGASAECAGPRAALVFQRGQDRLLADAAAECAIPGGLRLLKNSRDAAGHVYGCQENYETEVARGLGLWLFRAGSIALVLLHVVHASICLAGFGLVAAVLIGLDRLRGKFSGHRDARLALRLWPVIEAVLRQTHRPLAMLFMLWVRCTAFRRQRRHLTAFLVSRTVLCGAGHLDVRGRFRVAAKATAIDRVADIGLYRGERPMFGFRPWLKAMYGFGGLQGSTLRQLLARRQRLQISLADSNLADEAEYLKVATTALVLDLIESGGTDGLPRLRNPIAALDRISSDWTMIGRVATSRGEMTALEIQRVYLRACRRMVERRGAKAPAEATEILQRWERALSQLRAIRRDPADFLPALGRIDWVTKRWMIERLGPSAEWMARKKVDLRYHELSDGGYAWQLRETLPESVLVGADEADWAGRMPPPHSPAAMRGRLIRELAGGAGQVRAEWDRVSVDRPQGGRRMIPIPRGEYAGDAVESAGPASEAE